MRYKLKLKMTQQVERLVHIDVTAFDEEDAIEKIKKELETYPHEVITSNITRIFSPVSRYTPPENIEILEIRRDKRFD